MTRNPLSHSFSSSTGGEGSGGGKKKKKGGRGGGTMPPFTCKWLSSCPFPGRGRGRGRKKKKGKKKGGGKAFRRPVYLFFTVNSLPSRKEKRKERKRGERSSRPFPSLWLNLCGGGVLPYLLVVHSDRGKGGRKGGEKRKGRRGEKWGGPGFSPW